MKKIKYQILYIDSIKKDLDFFSLHFSKIYSVFTAETLNEAIGILKNQNINLIINGQENFLKENAQLLLQANSLVLKPSFILLSTSPDFSQLKNLLKEINLYQIVNKPYVVDNLQMIIHNALDNYKLKLDNTLYQKTLQENKTSMEEQISTLKNFNKTKNSILYFLEEAIYLATPDNVILYNNPAMKKIIGHDATGEKCHKAIYGLNDICPHCFLRKKKDDLQKYRSEIVYKGRCFTKYYSYLEDGSRLCVYHDITEQKDNEEKFRSIFINSNDAIMLSEINHHLPGLFIDVNDAACKKLGYTREELLKLSPFDITAQELVPKIKQKTKNIFTDKHLIYESVEVTKSGEYIFVEINASIIALQGQPIFLSIIRDITERKKSLETLKSKTKELELFNKLMIGREMQIIKIKNEVNQLSKELGRKNVYREIDTENEEK